MKRQWTIVFLLVICTTVIVLQLSGGFAESMQAIKHAMPGTIAVPGPRALIIDVLSFVAWVWGLVLTARARRWRWLALILVTGYIGGCLYSLVTLFRKVRGESDEHQPALTHP
ncbi:MAG: hypothetical protein IRZ31_16615 [Thermogemmatispora sp.]|uniref:hypothetical protein n=1 Tax=Thermogemmatispora sp. TaxID=1968838 RepID=UPI0026106F35|nr:hypothetical protein [Thermogemmatispora sp.]MBX5458516.1 hypothetical protein [Thermogemmatispora sp.]